MPFVSSAGQLRELYEDFSDDVQFLLIYCREAHPVDGASPGGRTMVEDPLTDAERRDVAAKFVADMGLPMLALLDGVDDAVGKAYASHPDRLYLIGKDGRIAYAGARGPFGFEPDELRAAIEVELAGDQMAGDQNAAPRRTSAKIGAASKAAPTSLRAALDADGDGELSSDEIARAVQVLRKLDKNKDGKLSGWELPGAGVIR